MADETQRPVESTPEQPTPIDPDAPPKPIEEMQDKTVRELRAEPVPVEAMPEEAQATLDLPPDAAPERTPTEAILDKPIEAIEDTVNALDRETSPATPAAAHAPPHNRNETVLFGRTIPLPLYTVVFITLGIVTITEVLIAEIFPHGIGTTILLLGLSLFKAVLVVLFYMHLREDSRIFTWTLVIPVAIALVAALFLLSVPITGY
jgi:caa(3)-type oxidase subunit IV